MGETTLAEARRRPMGMVGVAPTPPRTHNRSRYPVEGFRRPGLVDRTELRCFARAMHFPGHLFLLSPTVTKALETDGTIALEVLRMHVIAPHGDLRPHVNKVFNHHDAPHNLTNIRAALDAVLARKFSFAELDDVVTAYICFQGAHEGIGMDDWPLREKDKDSHGAFHELAKTMVAQRKRATVEVQKVVPGVGEVGNAGTKKDWGPIRLELMLALKMAGRVGAPGEVREMVRGLNPSAKGLPKRILFVEFLALVHRLPRFDPYADLTDTDQFLDFSTTVPLYTLANFEVLLRTPDERRHQRLTADFAMKQVRRAEERREAAEALKQAKLRAQEYALCGGPPPPKPTGASGMWKMAAGRAMADAPPVDTTPLVVNRPTSAPVPTKRPVFGRQTHAVPQAPTSRPSATSARAASADFSRYYDKFKHRLQHSALPTKTDASDLDKFLTVQGFGASEERLVTDDDIRESQINAEDLRWSVDAPVRRPSTVIANTARYGLTPPRSAQRPASAVTSRQTRPTASPTHGQRRPGPGTPRGYARPMTATVAEAHAHHPWRETAPRRRSVNRRVNTGYMTPTSASDSEQDGIGSDSDASEAQHVQGSGPEQSGEDKPTTSRNAETATAPAQRWAKPSSTKLNSSDRGDAHVDNTLSSNHGTDDWEVLFPPSQASIQAHKELEQLKASIKATHMPTGSLHRNWHEPGAWVGAS
eukprot:m.49757 g.49757  ORF g.49757 m.49757 type:complete len:703 (-) comp7161_c0_seq1:100-2208(-)